MKDKSKLKKSSIRIDSMKIRGEIREKVMLKMCFEGVQARYDTKMSRESIPAAWCRVGEGFFTHSSGGVKLRRVK